MGSFIKNSPDRNTKMLSVTESINIR